MIDASPFSSDTKSLHINYFHLASALKKKRQWKTVRWNGAQKWHSVWLYIWKRKNNGHVLNGYERCYLGFSNPWIFLQFPFRVYILLHCRDWLLIAASLQPFINLRWQVDDGFIACIRWVKCKWNHPQISVLVCIYHPLHFLLSSETQWAPYHHNLNYRSLTTAPLERLHIFLTLIILTDAKVPWVPRRITKMRIRVEGVWNILVPVVSHTVPRSGCVVQRCCSAAIVATRVYSDRCCLIIAYW